MLPGEYATYDANGLVGYGGFLAKTDTAGNVIWARLYDSSQQVRKHLVYFIRTMELQDGSLVTFGRTENRLTNHFEIVILKTDSQGNILWTQTLESRLWQGFSGSGDFFDLANMVEDPASGDIYLSGNFWFSTTTVTRLDGRTGAVRWNRGYDYSEFDYAFGVVCRQSDILMFQYIIGSYASHFAVLRLDKNTGDTLSAKTFEYQSTGLPPLFYGASDVVQLNNGHFFLTAPTIPSLVYPQQPGQDVYYAGIIELDADLNFIQCFGFKGKSNQNLYNTRLTVFPDGTGVLNTLDVISGYSGFATVVQFDHDRILQERRRVHVNEGFPLEPNYVQLENGRVLNVKTSGDSTRLAMEGSRIEYYRVHPADTPSACLGVLSREVSLFRLNYRPSPRYIDSVRVNLLQPAMPLRLRSTSFDMRVEPACVITSACDSLDLRVSDSVVCQGAPVELRIRKNRECGGLVPLTYDTSWVESMTQVTDSTFRIRFRAGEGYLRGVLRGCTLLTDSVFVRVTPARTELSIGPDTAVCPGNSVTLRAGAGFATYRWQDGSSDSTYQAQAPGLYHVEVSNGCGLVLRDSVVIREKFAQPIDLGPDRLICAGDTVSLAAPEGLLSYQWSGNYRISSLTAPRVVVDPLTDTTYQLRAEESPGCFVVDAVRIVVRNAPPLSLGPDRQVCDGDSVLLQVPDSFVSFAWNSGHAGRVLYARNPGIYAVQATSSDGCVAADTMRLLPHFPAPVVSLDKRPGLCAGESRILDAGSFAAYQWSTGDNTPAITVRGTGTYRVIVTDLNGCSATDSTVITTLYPVPANFLPPDTVVCSYTGYNAAPLQRYSQYRWSSGETTSSIFVRSPGTIRLDVTDQQGCSGRDTMTVAFRDCMTGVYVPNAFTPNGDGVNDLFYPLVYGRVAQFSFSVYNRFGQRVFSSQQPGTGWDGTVKGAAQPSGVFTWVCVYQLDGAEVKRERGTVMLIR